MSKISVIIPVYRAEAFLCACLDSVVTQTYGNLEIICINDGSPDSSGEILAEYAARDSRITVITKENGGVSAARNDGLDRATGEYIHFMDADDFLDSNYYETLLNAAIGMDADVACSSYRSNSKCTNGVVYKKNSVATTMYKKMQKTTAFVNSYIWRYLFHRDLIKDLRFRTDLVAQEDAVFLFDALVLAKRVVVVSGTIYHYVLNENSILNRRDKEHLKKVNRDYEWGKKYRREFAQKHDLMLLWHFRKLRKLPFLKYVF